MNKTISGVILAAGIALGAGGVSAFNNQKVYVHGLDVARLPTPEGGHSFATGAAHGATFKKGEDGKVGTVLLGSKRIDYTAEEQSCLNAVMDRAEGLFK